MICILCAKCSRGVGSRRGHRWGRKPSAGLESWRRERHPLTSRWRAWQRRGVRGEGKAGEEEPRRQQSLQAQVCRHNFHFGSLTSAPSRSVINGRANHLALRPQPPINLEHNRFHPGAFWHQAEIEKKARLHWFSTYWDSRWTQYNCYKKKKRCCHKDCMVPASIGGSRLIGKEWPETWVFAFSRKRPLVGGFFFLVIQLFINHLEREWCALRWFISGLEN